jgi:hypothetical protein
MRLTSPLKVLVYTLHSDGTILIYQVFPRHLKHPHIKKKSMEKKSSNIHQGMLFGHLF